MLKKSVMAIFVVLQRRLIGLQDVTSALFPSLNRGLTSKSQMKKRRNRCTFNFFAYNFV